MATAVCSHGFNYRHFSEEYSMRVAQHASPSAYRLGSTASLGQANNCENLRHSGAFQSYQFPLNPLALYSIPYVVEFSERCLSTTVIRSSYTMKTRYMQELFYLSSCSLRRQFHPRQMTQHFIFFHTSNSSLHAEALELLRPRTSHAFSHTKG